MTPIMYSLPYTWKPVYRIKVCKHRRYGKLVYKRGNGWQKVSSVVNMEHTRPAHVYIGAQLPMLTTEKPSAGSISEWMNEWMNEGLPQTQAKQLWPAQGLTGWPQRSLCCDGPSPPPSPRKPTRRPLPADSKSWVFSPALGKMHICSHREMKMVGHPFQCAYLCPVSSSRKFTGFLLSPPCITAAMI